MRWRGRNSARGRHSTRQTASASVQQPAASMKREHTPPPSSCRAQSLTKLARGAHRRSFRSARRKGRRASSRRSARRAVHRSLRSRRPLVAALGLPSASNRYPRPAQATMTLTVGLMARGCRSSVTRTRCHAIRSGARCPLQSCLASPMTPQAQPPTSEHLCQTVRESVRLHLRAPSHTPCDAHITARSKHAALAHGLDVRYTA